MMKLKKKKKDFTYGQNILFWSGMVLTAVMFVMILIFASKNISIDMLSCIMIIPLLLIILSCFLSGENKEDYKYKYEFEIIDEIKLQNATSYNTKIDKINLFYRKKNYITTMERDKFTWRRKKLKKQEQFFHHILDLQDKFLIYVCTTILGFISLELITKLNEMMLIIAIIGIVSVGIEGILTFLNRDYRIDYLKDSITYELELLNNILS